MSEINVQLKNGEPVPVPDSATVAEALKKLDRDLAKQALAAKIGVREVYLRASLDGPFVGRGSARSFPRHQTRYWTSAARRSTLRLFLRRDNAAAAY
jgi:hypothetical protein